MRRTILLIGLLMPNVPNIIGLDTGEHSAQPSIIVWADAVGHI